MGRPTKCTPELTDAICALLRDGMGREAAARTVGIDVATFCRWMQKGQRRVRPYREFRRRVEEASDTLHKEVVEVLVGKGLRSDNPERAVKTGMWMAERLWPDAWSKRTEVRTTGADGGPVAVAVTGKLAVALFTDAQLRDMAPEQIAAAIDALGNKLEPEEPG